MGSVLEPFLQTLNVFFATGKHIIDLIPSVLPRHTFVANSVFTGVYFMFEGSKMSKCKLHVGDTRGHGEAITE
jgi:hypothetical protein